MQTAFKERLAGKAVDKKLIGKLGLWHAREAIEQEISESRWQRLGKISESKVRVVEIAALSQQRTELAMRLVECVAG